MVVINFCGPGDDSFEFLGIMVVVMAIITLEFKNLTERRGGVVRRSGAGNFNK